MNQYEAKQEARRERLLNAADRAKARSAAAFERADLREEKSGIPMGQPIIVGHHSERRHRRALERSDAAMRASIEADKKAKELREKAAGVGKGGISSDDPEAVRKLKEQLAGAQRAQEFMREANKVIRRAVKAGVSDAESEGFEAYRAELAALKDNGEISVGAAYQLLQKDFAGRIGFANYQLSNNNANIKRIEGRIRQLEAQAKIAAECEDGEKRVDYGFCEVVENFEENRIQILFDGKPGAEIRSELKSRGFRWAPSQGAWQRHLNNAGRYAASAFIKSQKGE